MKDLRDAIAAKARPRVWRPTSGRVGHLPNDAVSSGQLSPQYHMSITLLLLLIRDQML